MTKGIKGRWYITDTIKFPKIKIKAIEYIEADDINIYYSARTVYKDGKVITERVNGSCAKEIVKLPDHSEIYTSLIPEINSDVNLIGKGHYIANSNGIVNKNKGVESDGLSPLNDSDLSKSLVFIRPRKNVKKFHNIIKDETPLYI